MRTKTLQIIFFFAPLACASEGARTDGTSEGSSTSSSSMSGTSVGDGTDAGSATGTESDSTTGDSGSGTTTSDGTGDTTGNGESTSSSSGSSDSGSTTGNDTGSTTGGPDLGGGETGGGQQINPGDDCDPFVDECLDQGGDYECQSNLRFNQQENKSEVYFKCTELDDSLGDGMYASACHIKPYEQCTQGFWCKSAGFFPQNTCQTQACCIELCYDGQDCGGNDVCNTTVWAADLADYLDMYGGIGNCP